MFEVSGLRQHDDQAEHTHGLASRGTVKPASDMVGFTYEKMAVDDGQQSSMTMLWLGSILPPLKVTTKRQHITGFGTTCPTLCH